MNRPIIQKTENAKNQKLRDSARYAPYCFGCGKPNPDPEHGILCLAHANGLVAGKAMGMKSPDENGAVLCPECHYQVDHGHWTRERKREFHSKAAAKTYSWWVQIGLIGG